MTLRDAGNAEGEPLEDRGADTSEPGGLPIRHADGAEVQIEPETFGDFGVDLNLGRGGSTMNVLISRESDLSLNSKYADAKVPKRSVRT